MQIPLALAAAVAVAVRTLATDAGRLVEEDNLSRESWHWVKKVMVKARLPDQMTTPSSYSLKTLG